MLVDIALWIILLAMFALVPVGCILTRSPRTTDPA
jgi:hypothetical protein